MSSAVDYNETQVIIGPNVGLWWNVTLPAANTQLVIDANGYPPDGRPLGYTDRGCTLTVDWQAPPEEAWDQQEPYRVYQANQMSMEGTLVQVLDLDKMRILMPAPGGCRRAVHAAGPLPGWSESRDLRLGYQAGAWANVAADGVQAPGQSCEPQVRVRNDL